MLCVSRQGLSADKVEGVICHGLMVALETIAIQQRGSGVERDLTITARRMTVIDPAAPWFCEHAVSYCLKGIRSPQIAMQVIFPQAQQQEQA